ncbi:MAG: hypothetical protein QF847_07230 [Candidatus Marinimicrobia bacterium]|jgi:hypothetical protein|nr:hypothetical protein [Candidatus Neomarinimicrobiota bacterium]MDP6727024.1 hypothetical protein [Candidatus Neomarinimicrobiota bacterium]|tara:strand:+ start:352 stop:585 length:234 start_codon:yes stop_codon:yes gene_type:complete
MEGTAPGQLFTVGLVVLQIGFTMKKDTYTENQIHKYLSQLHIQHRCGLIIARNRDEKEKYKDKFLQLLEIIGPMAKA